MTLRQSIKCFWGLGKQMCWCEKALKCLFSVGRVWWSWWWRCTPWLESSPWGPAVWATGWPGWVSLEGEGAWAQSLGPAGASGSGLGLPERSGPRTPGGFPSWRALGCFYTQLGREGTNSHTYIHTHTEERKEVTTEMVIDSSGTQFVYFNTGKKKNTPYK